MVQTVVGAMQDAMSVGVVCSYQYWKYRAKPGKEYVETVDEYGQTAYIEQSKPEVLEDKPCIELFPVENLRIDPGADWVDPVKSSPYVIRMVPMYVIDVKAQMANVDDKTHQPKWKKLEDGETAHLAALRFDATSPKGIRQQGLWKRSAY